METLRWLMKLTKKKTIDCCFKYVKWLILAIACIVLLSTVTNGEETFKSLTINDAYMFVLENHESIKIAEKEIEKSKLLPKKATTMLMPRAYLDGGYRKLDDSIEFEAEVGAITLPPVETVPEESWFANFKYNQPIYVGEFFPRRKQATKVIESTTEKYYQTIQDILFRVARTYYEFLKSEELVQNAKEILKLTQEELRVSKVKFKTGDVTEDAVLKSELNLTRAKANIIKNVNHYKLIQDVFITLIGIEKQDVNLVKPPELRSEKASYEDLVQKAFEHRHDYKETQMKVDVVKSDIDLVKSRFHPELSASWDYFWIDNPNFLQDDEYWLAAIKLRIPIFEGGSRFLDIKEKLKSLQQAEYALKSLEDAIRLEVQDARLTVLTEKSTLANLTKQVELAEKSYEIVFNKFKFGAATSVELNEALVSLDVTRTQFISKTYNYQVAILSLDKAMGIFASDFTQLMEHKLEPQ
jgi:outer membrane protein TolC